MSQSETPTQRLHRMRAASRHYVGEIDFTSMTPTHTVRETMVRRVFRCDIDRHLDEVRIDVLGEGFLYRQVRNMVGTLIEIGRGYWEPDYLQQILAKLEAYFGRPYPYRKLDTLVIPTTQGFGAMEHPGLITFASRLARQ